MTQDAPTGPRNGPETGPTMPKAIAEGRIHDAGNDSHAAPSHDHDRSSWHDGSLWHDRSFWAMTVTQFLGAFNDSVFKQILLLLCLTVVVVPGEPAVDKQFVAQGVFAIAFILFSGIAGYWSDRIAKRWIVIGAKVGEIVVMLCAVAAFAAMTQPEAVYEKTASGQWGEATYYIHGMPWMLLAVLFLMGTQSAVFGPAKYGILPELVPGPDLPRFNGVIQMTTFFALILGPWVGGILLGIYSQRLWIGGLVCVAIAVAGTATSLFVRRTPVAQPGAPFGWSSIAIGSDTFALLKSDRALRNALWVYSLFWFVGALIPMLVNWLGKQQFGLNYADTSFMLATVSIGIAAGFVLAGKLSHGHVNFRLVRIGTWGLIVSLLLIALPGVGSADMEDASVASSVAETGSAETFAKMPPNLLGYRGSQLALVAAGFFAGFFALPVQVFLQSRPPAHLKGRVIGAMNLINWIAIILAAVVFYPMCLQLLDWLELPKFCAFGITALMLLPVALFYHPQNEEL